VLDVFGNSYKNTFLIIKFWEYSKEQLLSQLKRLPLKWLKISKYRMKKIFSDSVNFLDNEN